MDRAELAASFRSRAGPSVSTVDARGSAREQSIVRPLQLHGPNKAWPAVRSGLTRLGSRSAAIVCVLLLWEIAPRHQLVERAFLPPLSEVLATGVVLVKNGQLASHIAASLSRSLLGFGVAIAVAVPLGLAIGSSRWICDFLHPLLEIFRNTAALALLPVFILLLGIGESSKVAIVIYTCASSILLNTISGVRGVDPLLIKSARTMGVSKAALLYKVTLPAALPTIFVGIRLAGAHSLLVLVAAEMVGAKAGLGYLIQYSQYNFQIPHMYVGIVTTTMLGLAFAKALLWIEWRFTSWKAPAPD